MSKYSAGADSSPTSKQNISLAGRDIVFSGSFDPITLGHIALLRRILPRFEHIHIVVASGMDKKALFPLDERCILVRKSLEDVEFLSPYIKICKWDGLIVDYCKQHNVPSILRGLRNLEDLKFEKTMANINSQLNSQVETFFLLAEPTYRDVSSTAIKQLAKVCTHPQQLEKFVTKSVIKKLLEQQHSIERK